MVEKALRAGQYAIVISQNHATRFFRRKYISIYVADAGDQTVSGSSFDKIIQRTPSALSGHGQGAIFNKSSCIKKILHIGARGALIFFRSFRHHIRAVFIQPVRMPFNHLCQIRAQRIAVGFFFRRFNIPFFSAFFLYFHLPLSPFVFSGNHLPDNFFDRLNIPD